MDRLVPGRHETPDMSEHEPRQSLGLGALFITLTMLGSAMVAGLVKWASAGFSSELIMVVRFGAGFLFFLPLLYLRPRVSLRTNQFATQAAVAVLGVLGTLVFYYSIRFIRLMDAALLLNTAALFAPILARVFDGKREPWLVWTGTLIGFIGVAFVLRPGPALLENPISAIGLLAGFFTGLRVFLTARLKGEPAKRTTFYSLLLGIGTCLVILVLAGLPIRVPAWETMLFTPREAATPDFVDSSLIVVAIGVGLISMVLPLLTAAGLRHASVGQIAPFRYTAVVFAGVIDFIFWGVIPTWPSWVGFALVFAGAVVVVRAAAKGGGPRVEVVPGSERSRSGSSQRPSA